MRASEQAQDCLSPPKNRRDKQTPSWRCISCHADRNRYSDNDAALVLSTVSCPPGPTLTLPSPSTPSAPPCAQGVGVPASYLRSCILLPSSLFPSRLPPSPRLQAGPPASAGCGRPPAGRLLVRSRPKLPPRKPRTKGCNFKAKTFVLLRSCFYRVVTHSSVVWRWA